MQALSRAFPIPVILLNKARWGRDGGPGGKGTPLTRQLRGFPSPQNLNPQPSEVP